MIELVKALAWPIATIIVAFSAVIIVYRVTNASGKFKLKFRDWFNLEREDGPAIDAPHIDLQATLANPAVAKPAEDESAPTAAETLDEVSPQENENTKFFTLEDDPKKLEKSFDQFRFTSDAYQEDKDFWESLYVNRKRELGIGDEEADLRYLATSNTNWVWPLIFLIRRYIRLHDSSSAEQSLRLALSRVTPENKKWVLKEGVALYHTMFGTEKALRFVHDQINLGCSDSEISVMLRQLASYGIKDDAFSNAMVGELAESLSAENDNLFDLAYSYGFSGDFGAIAFHRYRECGDRNKYAWSASNNMGVIVKNNPVVEISYFEESVSSGNPIAIANLSRRLISDGYLKRASLLLEAVDKSDLDGEHAAALADARAKLTAAELNLQKNRKKFEDFAASQDRRYKAFVFSSFEYFKKVGTDYDTGAFVSADRTIGLIIAKDTARCIYKFGDHYLGGTLTRKPLCLDGSISGPGGGGLLDYAFRRILAVQSSTDEVRVIVWPKSFDVAEPLQIIELTRVSGFGGPVLGEADLSLERATTLLEGSASGLPDAPVQ